MNFDPTEEQRLIREMVRRVAEQEIAPVAAEHDRAGRFPRDLVNRLASLGLLGGPIPKDYGGSGLDYISHAIITEEVGRVDSSLRTTLSVQVSLVALSLLKWGSDEQKRRYLPELCAGRMLGCFGLTEPNAGSNPAGMETLAARRGDRWVLNGVKTWISNGPALIVHRLFPTQDEVGLQPTDRGAQRHGGCETVAVFKGGIAQQDRLVSAHREAGAQGLLRFLRRMRA